MKANENARTDPCCGSSQPKRSEGLFFLCEYNEGRAICNQQTAIFFTTYVSLPVNRPLCAWYGDRMSDRTLNQSPSLIRKHLRYEGEERPTTKPDIPNSVTTCLAPPSHRPPPLRARYGDNEASLWGTRGPMSTSWRLRFSSSRSESSLCRPCWAVCLINLELPPIF